MGMISTIPYNMVRASITKCIIGVIPAQQYIFLFMFWYDINIGHKRHAFAAYQLFIGCHEKKHCSERMCCSFVRVIQAQWCSFMS